MNEKYVILLAILLCSVAITGCIGDDSEEMIEQLENEATESKAIMESLNKTIQALGAEVTVYQSAMASLNATIEALGAEAIDYQSAMASLNATIEALGAEAIDYQSAMASLNATIEALGAEVVDRKSAMELMNITIESMDAEISSLESLIALLNSTIEDLEEALAEVDDGVTQDDVDAAREEGRAQGIAEASPESTLDVVLERGSLKCGVKGSQYGMGYQDGNGQYSGLDISYCTAVAAAIGLDPDTDIEYIVAHGNNRFQLLADGELDVLIRTTTWTTSRDADLDVDFGAINFYDGQGIMVNLDEFPGADSALDLDGASICVAIGSTSAGNIADYFDENGMDYTAVNSGNDGPDFANEQCDAVTGDMSSLVAMKWEIEQNGAADFEMAIMPEIISKEPLASATRDYDSEWNEVVSWVWYGMVTAEELGISSQNYQIADTNVPAIDRLLNENLGLGTEDNPLSSTWMQEVLEAVGNYGEAYDDAFCDGTYDGESGSGGMSGCLISRSGTLNALESEGGLQYAPPMR